MPDGSSGPGPPPTSTTTFNIVTDETPYPQPPRKFLLTGPKPPLSELHDTMKPKIFGGPPTSPTTPRPRTGHQSIRGRISGPIPIPNPLDDDEFPMRNPGTGIASSTPIENDTIQRQLQQGPSKPASPVTPSFAPSVAQTFPLTGARVDIVDVPHPVLEHPSTPTQQPPHSSSTVQGGTSPEGGASNVSATHSSTAKAYRATLPNSARYSTTSANSDKTGPSPSPVDALHGPPQRKKSTLRSALGKFLRRRKKEGSLSSVSEADRQSAIVGQQQHRSVPPAARTIQPQHIQPRVTSMPISEFDRALRSHSVGPDDITAIESVRNSIDALGSSPARQRAATAINTRIITSGIIPRSRGEEWAGLSPRPASTHARASRFTEDPEAIGRAITSDSNGGDMAHKRRSRSLSQLNEVALQQAGGRRRSDEIRYWRESYDVPGPLSPLSSVPPNEHEMETNDDNYDVGRVSMSVADSAAERIPKTPPQPFNFGSLASMNEMAGMKITQAASLDERFGNLEVRMYKLERVVSQLCHSVPGFKGPFMEVSAPSIPSGRHRSGSASAGAGVPTQHVHVSHPTYAYSNVVPPMIPAIYQAPSRDGPVPSSRYTNHSRRSVDTTTDDNTSSRMSFGEGQTYIDSLHPPSSSATQAVSTVATSVPPVPGLLRPLSEATVRPVASMPSLGSQDNTNGEERSSNSAALMAQLEQERAHRQLLEDQVRKLSERMNNLSTTMFAMVRDPAKSRSSDRLRPQTAHSTLNAAPAGNPHLSMLNLNTGGVAPSSKAQSIFGKDSVPTGALNSLASSPTKEVADDEFSDAFQTPRELPIYNQAFGDDFGAGYTEQGDDEDLEERKRAARTMSLSKLTMGNGVPTRI